jgi:hypothetical protein
MGDRCAASASCFCSISSLALIEFNIERIFFAKFLISKKKNKFKKK